MTHAEANDYGPGDASDAARVDLSPQLRSLNKELILALSTNSRYREYLVFHPDIQRIGSEHRIQNSEFNFGYGEDMLLPQLYWSVTELRIHGFGNWTFSLKSSGGRRTFFTPTDDGMLIPQTCLRVGPAASQRDEGDMKKEFTLELSRAQGLLRAERPPPPLRLYDFVKGLISPPASNNGVKQGAPLFWFQKLDPQNNNQLTQISARFFVQSAARVFWEQKILAKDPNPKFLEVNKADEPPTIIIKNKPKYRINGKMSDEASGDIVKGTFPRQHPSFPNTDHPNLWYSRISNTDTWLRQVQLRILAFRHFQVARVKLIPEANRTRQDQAWLADANGLRSDELKYLAQTETALLFKDELKWLSDASKNAWMRDMYDLGSRRFYGWT